MHQKLFTFKLRGQKFWFFFSKSVHKLHPRLFVVPLPSWLPPIGHLPGPWHWGSFSFGNLLRYSPLICRLWHASQKWVDPQQNHWAIEQQNLHLKLMKSFPCFKQFIAPSCAGQHWGQTKSYGLNCYPYRTSFIASAQFFLPPK